jgi:transcriptional regulator with XRE-family HTH domain
MRFCKARAARALLTSFPNGVHLSARLNGFGRRGIMANSIDLHVGKRLRRRRRLLGMTQQQLASSVGIRFQQIQKYESGANRITASRLYELSTALSVAVQYFFEGLQPIAAGAEAAANENADISPDVMSQKETMELLRAYYRLGERPRRRLLDLAKALQEDASDAA